MSAWSAAHAAQELEAARGDDLTDFAAELARVQQERDELAAELKQVTQQRQYRSDMLALVRAELASARSELEQLRPIVAAARAYVTFPDRPTVQDPNEAHSRDLEAERRYYALAELITTTEGAPPA